MKFVTSLAAALFCASVQMRLSGLCAVRKAPQRAAAKR